MIGKAKVMSYDDIVEAQIKRDMKEVGMGGGTRGSKRKGNASISVVVKRSRTKELEDAKYEIEASGMGKCCSVCSYDSHWKQYPCVCRICGVMQFNTKVIACACCGQVIADWGCGLAQLIVMTVFVLA